MKSTIIFIIIVMIINLIIPAALASDSTPSADIRAKLEELKKQIASKAAKLKQEVNRKLKDKAYVGILKAKSDTTLTLAAGSGPKVVSINQDTVFESNVKSKQKFSQKTLSSEDYVAALGDADETGVLIAKKIILLPPVNQKPKTYLWGQIISISDQLATIKNNEFKNVAVTLPDQPEVKLNDFVILTGTKDKNNILNAAFAYVIPQGGIIKLRKTATPSAQVSSPSAKPAPKKAS